MKKKNIIIFITLCLCITFWNLIINVIQNDEIWNYGFAHNIYKGLIPYKDFNMVVTPFYPFIMSLGFHLFGSSMLVFHIENAIIMTLICFIVYKLLKEKIYIWGLFIVFFSDVLTFPSYNLFLLFLILLIIYLEKYKKNDYLIGIIIGISILTKQSIGLFMAIPSLYYLKNDYKKVLKRIIGALIPGVIFLLFLLYNKCLNQFLDLCLYGLLDFGKKNTKELNIGYLFFIIYIVVSLYLIKKDKKNIMNYYVLVFSSMMLPLFDVHHTIVAYSLLLISIILTINIKTKFNLSIIFYTVTVFIAFIMFTTNNKGLKIIYPNNINHFEYRFIEEHSINFTNNITNYLKEHSENDFVFITSGAYYYRLITDTRMSYLDLINYGNFGYNGTEKLIKQIKMTEKGLII